MKQSAFRLWVQRIWFEYKDECSLYKEEAVNIEQYWSKYKYWLKREYKHQKTLESVGESTR